MVLSQHEVQRRWTYSRLLIGCILLFGSAAALSASDWDREGARRAWEEARRLRAELDRSSTPSRQDYLRCIRTYETVYLKDPHFGGSDDSVYEAARLFQESAERFTNEGDYRRAARLYRFLLSDYDASPHCPDALLRLGDLAAGPLRDEEASLEAYEQLRSRYPSSEAAAALGARTGAAPPSPARTEEKSASEPKAGAQPASPPGNGPAVLTDVRYRTEGDSTQVSLIFDREVRYSESRIDNPDRLFLDISGSRLAADLMHKTIPVGSGFLKQIRVDRNRPGVMRVVLDLDRLPLHSTRVLHNPFRIRIDLENPRPDAAASGTAARRSEEAPARTPPERKEQPSAPVAAALQPEAAKPGHPGFPEPPIPPKEAAPTSRGKRTLTRMLGLKISRIVLDPGHGGTDQGTVGPDGLLEKDLVLDVARDLKNMLESRLGAEVILTRDSDTFIPLEERTAIANQSKADLFLSIHANSSPRRSTTGVETYFLDFARTSETREVAARENATTTRSINDLQDMIRRIAQADKMVESRELAAIVQKFLFRGARNVFPSTRNRGVRTAPFVVLIGAKMPSVLAEIAFLSNPRDEKLLQKENSRRKLAASLLEGIETYMKTLGGNAARYRTEFDEIP